MADKRYVKLLTREQDALQDITPGELHQPIEVPQDSPCDPCMVPCCLHLCAICQEHREMRNHLSDDASSESTIVSPPPVQEMNYLENKESAPSDEQNNLQIQPV